MAFGDQLFSWNFSYLLGGVSNCGEFHLIALWRRVPYQNMSLRTVLLKASMYPKSVSAHPSLYNTPNTGRREDCVREMLRQTVRVFSLPRSLLFVFIIVVVVFEVAQQDVVHAQTGGCVPKPLRLGPEEYPHPPPEHFEELY